MSTRLEKQDGDLTHVEINKMFCFMGNVRSEVSTNDTVPGWVVFLVKLFFNVGGNVLFDVKFL